MTNTATNDVTPARSGRAATLGRHAGRRAAAVCVAAGLALAATGAPAHAATRLGGSCEALPFSGQGYVFYSVNGNATTIEKFQYRQGGAGNQTIVFLRIKADISGAADPNRYGPVQRSNLSSNVTYEYDNTNFTRPTSEKSYATFQFRFDKDNRPDTECTGRTLNF